MNDGDDTHRPFEYSAITDAIFVGTNGCCRMHFDEMLAREGVTYDISLEEDRLDAPFGVTAYVWIPVRDKTPPSPEQFAFGVAVLRQILRSGRRVYVHCRNGHGRAPTLVAAYLIGEGQSAADALAVLKTRRPTVHVEPAQQAALEDIARQQNR